MIIDVLVCRADGSQTLEKQEVPEDWFTLSDALADALEEN